MVKYFALLVNLSMTLFMSFLFQTPVQVGVNVPDVVNAGESLEVAVTLNKGNVEGFARYMQQLPLGLSATPSVSSNADFSFKDQKIRLIWLRLPEDEETVTFTYRIHVDKRLKGEFNFEGLFSYIEENERKSVNTISPVISIVPSPDLPESEIVDISEFGNAVIQDLTPKVEENVICYRQTPQISEINNEAVINIIVHKGSDRFAKIEESIPEGYSAVAIDAQEAIFSSRDNMVKFLWMNLPADEYFTVSYKLVPNQSLDKNIEINGVFSYIEDDDKTISVDIVQKDFILSENTSEKIGEIFNKLIKGESFTETNVDVAVNNENTNQESNTALPDELIGDNVNVSLLEEKKDDKVSSSNTTQKNTPKVNKVSKNRIARKSDLLKPEAGVYYRIQLAAGHRSVNIRQYFRKFHLEKSVKKEQHEGWYKYSVGSFKEYLAARDYRNYIWRTTIIDDAFVSAYNEGSRITVQEALMIANQSWYK